MANTPRNSGDISNSGKKDSPWLFSVPLLLGLFFVKLYDKWQGDEPREYRRTHFQQQQWKRFPQIAPATEKKPRSDLPRSTSVAQLSTEPKKLRPFNGVDERLFLMYTAEDSFFRLIRFADARMPKADDPTVQLAAIHQQAELYLQHIRDHTLGTELESTYVALLSSIDAHVQFLNFAQVLNADYERILAAQAVENVVSNTLNLFGHQRTFEHSGMSPQEATWATFGVCAVEFVSQISRLKGLDAERRQQLEQKSSESRASWFRFCSIAESASNTLAMRYDWPRNMQPFEKAANLLTNALKVSKNAKGSELGDLLEETRKWERTKNPYADLWVIFIGVTFDVNTSEEAKWRVDDLKWSKLWLRMSAMNVPEHRIYDSERLRWLLLEAAFADYQMRLASGWDGGHPLDVDIVSTASECAEIYNFALFYAPSSERNQLLAKRSVAFLLAGSEPLALKQAEDLSNEGFRGDSFILDYAKILGSVGKIEDARKQLVQVDVDRSEWEKLTKNVYLERVLAKRRK